MCASKVFLMKLSFPSLHLWVNTVVVVNRCCGFQFSRVVVRTRRAWVGCWSQVVCVCQSACVSLPTLQPAAGGCQSSDQPGKEGLVRSKHPVCLPSGAGWFRCRGRLGDWFCWLFFPLLSIGQGKFAAHLPHCWSTFVFWLTSAQCLHITRELVIFKMSYYELGMEKYRERENEGQCTCVLTTGLLSVRPEK